jgi:hypothetical protein
MGVFKIKNNKNNIKEVKGTLYINNLGIYTIETQEGKVIPIREEQVISGINTFKKELFHYITENEVYPDNYYYISKCRPCLADGIIRRKHIGKWLAYELIETEEPLTEDIINEWELIPMQ